VVATAGDTWKLPCALKLARILRKAVLDVRGAGELAPRCWKSKTWPPR
jgi:hypothetical protein